MKANIHQIIDHYGLELLPEEGVLFKNTYRSKWRTTDQAVAGAAMIGLFCHDPPSLSRFHQLDCDEIWHFYIGDPIQLHLLSPAGTYQLVVLGSDPLNGQKVQQLIPAGTWQAACVDETADFALFGCTTTPGFASDFFRPGLKSFLLPQYPVHCEIISKLGCD